jgi:pimeloyl-ACP methyl ester carboxylesterase
VVVLIHGFLDFAWTWEETALALSRDYRVIVPDLRGHGDSDWVGAGGYYHFLDYLADLDSLITSLCPDPVQLVGHSMGGSVACYWAATRPERCAGIVNLEGLGPVDQVDGGPERTRRWIENWRTVRTSPLRTLASLDEAVARMRRHDPLLSLDAARRLCALGTRQHASGLVWKHDPLHSTQGPYPFRVEAAAAYWRALRCPLLYIEGESSLLRLPPDERQRRLGHIADHHVDFIADAGHMMQRHQPREVARRCHAFFSPLMAGLPGAVSPSTPPA